MVTRNRSHMPSTLSSAYGSGLAVYFWASGLINSPQSHILKSVMFGLTFIELLSLRCSMQAIGCDDGIREEGFKSNRRATVLHIAGNLNQEATENVSEQAVRRTLHRLVYGSQ
ncbi:hypothetical protein TNCV_2279651 [Trichonephila clavipes]|uniref:Uncharacterized protein n=1 Tax=Trichonephila clavipes TaxID=2585209 RepID=A0A8X6RFD7_TRICX|nr:hypothetical protein TNCV_2279651 [Trichonephila clavipes]